LLDDALVYDSWGWLVWGREIAGLDLDTSAGPSWKPLPVTLTTAFAAAGDGAPDLWMFVARAGWLAAIGLAADLAARLVIAPRPALRVLGPFVTARIKRARILAGALAAIGVVLLFDPFTPWLRQFTGGLSEPLLVALVLGAVQRRIAGRSGQALALGFAAALLRPEAWPFLAAFGVWLWREQPGLRRWVVGVAIALPALWLVPDLLGSGTPFTGAERAREATGWPPLEALEAVGRSLNLVLAGLWVTAAYALFTARRNGERTLVVLAYGALAWIGLVAILAAVGYAGIPRFAAPAAALGCVLGAVGAVRLIAALAATGRADPRRPPLLAATTGLALVLALQAGIRVSELPGDLRVADERSAEIDRLFELVDSVGRERVIACGPVATTDFLSQTALAWKLELALSDVGLRLESMPASGSAFVDADAPTAVRAQLAATGSPVARGEGWELYRFDCADNS
jgi:hypothetical protein